MIFNFRIWIGYVLHEKVSDWTGLKNFHMRTPLPGIFCFNARISDPLWKVWLKRSGFFFCYSYCFLASGVFHWGQAYFIEVVVPPYHFTCCESRLFNEDFSMSITLWLYWTSLSFMLLVNLWKELTGIWRWGRMCDPKCQTKNVLSHLTPLYNYSGPESSSRNNQPCIVSGINFSCKLGFSDLKKCVGYLFLMFKYTDPYNHNVCLTLRVSD